MACRMASKGDLRWCGGHVISYPVNQVRVGVSAGNAPDEGPGGGTEVGSERRHGRDLLLGPGVGAGLVEAAVGVHPDQPAYPRTELTRRLNAALHE